MNQQLHIRVFPLSFHCGRHSSPLNPSFPRVFRCIVAPRCTGSLSDVLHVLTLGSQEPGVTSQGLLTVGFPQQGLIKCLIPWGWVPLDCHHVRNFFVNVWQKLEFMSWTLLLNSCESSVLGLHFWLPSIYSNQTHLPRTTIF